MTKKFNGKPMKYWENMAKENVVDALVRASFKCDSRSLPGKLAGKRLMELARAEDVEMVDKIINDRDNFVKNIHMILRGPDPIFPEENNNGEE